jgi:hypothetical protein
VDVADRARIYAAFADATRRLASAMDTKAGFVFAVNGALLTSLWIGARMSDVESAALWLAMGSSACAVLALLAALWVIVPRPSVDAALYGKRGSRPVSHYGYVVNRYAADGFAQFEHDVAQFDDADFAREALESHFIVSRIVHVKSKWVAIAGALTLVAMALAGIALLAKHLLA